MDCQLPRDEDGLASDWRVTGTRPEGVGSQTEPLTQRILERLGRPLWLWVGLWAATSLVRPLLLAVSLGASGRQLQASDIAIVLPAQVALAYVIVVTLVGVRLIVDRTRQLAPGLATLAPEGRAEPLATFGSLRGPMAVLAVLAAATLVTQVQRWGWLVTVVDLPLMLLDLVPIATFVWTYLVLLAGLNELGRVRLQPGTFPADRSLGLRPLGNLALTGFWLVLVAAVPLMLAASASESTFALSLIVILASVALLFLSMFRLHRQMTAAKAEYVEQARELYRQAYEPVRKDMSIAALGTQGQVLSVAQALLERAEHILEWPIDERATAWVAVVVTGVVTSLIVRVVLAAAGG
jgi:hypothetical protein